MCTDDGADCHDDYDRHRERLMGRVEVFVSPFLSDPLSLSLSLSLSSLCVSSSL